MHLDSLRWPLPLPLPPVAPGHSGATQVQPFAETTAAGVGVSAAAAVAEAGVAREVLLGLGSAVVGRCRQERNEGRHYKMKNRERRSAAVHCGPANVVLPEEVAETAAAAAARCIERRRSAAVAAAVAAATAGTLTGSLMEDGAWRRKTTRELVADRRQAVPRTRRPPSHWRGSQPCSHGSHPVRHRRPSRQLTAQPRWGSSWVEWERPLPPRASGMKTATSSAAPRCPLLPGRASRWGTFWRLPQRYCLASRSFRPTVPARWPPAC